MNDRLVRELRELISALDRRVPRIERIGESAIAHDAAVLKSQALRRLAEIESTRPAAQSSSGRAQRKATA